jgi:hypothetical protein
VPATHSQDTTVKIPRYRVPQSTRIPRHLLRRPGLKPVQRIRDTRIMQSWCVDVAPTPASWLYHPGPYSSTRAKQPVYSSTRLPGFRLPEAMAMCGAPSELGYRRRGGTHTADGDFQGFHGRRIPIFPASTAERVVYSLVTLSLTKLQPGILSALHACMQISTLHTTRLRVFQNFCLLPESQSSQQAFPCPCVPLSFPPSTSQCVHPRTLYIQSDTLT